MSTYERKPLPQWLYRFSKTPFVFIILLKVFLDVFSWGLLLLSMIPIFALGLFDYYKMKLKPKRKYIKKLFNIAIILLVIFNIGYITNWWFIIRPYQDKITINSYIVTSKTFPDDFKMTGFLKQPLLDKQKNQKLYLIVAMKNTSNTVIWGRLKYIINGRKRGEFYMDGMKTNMEKFRIRIIPLMNTDYIDDNQQEYPDISIKWERMYAK